MSSEKETLLRVRKKGFMPWLKKNLPYGHRLITSRPTEYRLIKFCLGLIYGGILAVGLYFATLNTMDLPDVVKQTIFVMFLVSLALGCAVSVQVRCICTLVLPTMFGKSGRSYVWTFCFGFLLLGPIPNLMYNGGEISRSISCSAQLTHNHTKSKAQLRLRPLVEIMQSLKEQSEVMDTTTSEIKKKFRPVENEVEDQSEIDHLKSDINRADREQDNGEDRLRKLENRHPKETGDVAEDSENKYKKKLDYRCEDVFSMGVLKCVDTMRETEKKCEDKMKILKFLCFPLKLTVFCKLITLIPGVTGINCNDRLPVNEGFGENFETAEAASDALDKNFEVNMMYKMVEADEAVHRRTAEDVVKSVSYEFGWRKEAFESFKVFIKRMLAFLFLRVLISAVEYHHGFVTNFNHDNIYTSEYFRHIDKRRAVQGKRKLLPLKKLESKELMDPGKMGLSKSEKKKLSKATVTIIIRAFTIGMVFFVDMIIYQIMDIIRLHSRIDYRQTGQHHIALVIHGNGVMGGLVRTLLDGFNSKMDIDYQTSNNECLPHPEKTPIHFLYDIGIVILVIWILCIFEAFGLRLRRLAAGFFYPKREKSRILYLYNDTLKKRKGFLKHARKQVLRKAKKNKLEAKVRITTRLIQKYPQLCGFLKVLGLGKMNCLVCDDKETGHFVRCKTKDCNIGYCKQCWNDIHRECFGCRDNWDNLSDSEDSMDNDSDDSGND